MSALLAILTLGLIVALFGGALVWLSSITGPKVRKTSAKLMPYECGLPGQQAKDTKISIKFYLTAILFIIFDIEIIFMYPWAVSYFNFMEAGMGGYILGAMGIFILLFVLGLIWEVKSKALDWN